MNSYWKFLFTTNLLNMIGKTLTALLFFAMSANTAIASVTYVYGTCSNFSTETCPAENANVVGTATSYQSGQIYREVVCRNGLHLEDGWKSALKYTVTVAKNMSQYTIRIMPFRPSYTVGGTTWVGTEILSYPPSPDTLETIAPKTLTFSTSANPTIEVVCEYQYTIGSYPTFK